MDAMKQLVEDAEFSVGVLGRAGEFVLVPLSEPEQLPKEILDDANHRGFRFCGVLALVNGKPSVKSEPDLDALYTVMHASMAFAQRVADKIKREKEGDAVDWLENLYHLPDSRA